MDGDPEIKGLQASAFMVQCRVPLSYLIEHLIEVAQGLALHQRCSIF